MFPPRPPMPPMQGGGIPAPAPNGMMGGPMMPPVPPMQPPMPMMPQPRQQQAPKKAKLPDVSKWLVKISEYEREFADWERRVTKIIKRYRDDTKEFSSANPAKFNILWSNVQTAIPATFSRLPKPDVSRRHSDNDPIGRVASLLLERGLEYEIEHYPDYRSAMKNSVFDRFIGGRGMSWVRYEPHFRAAEDGSPEDGFQITEDADEAEETSEAQEELDYECSPVDYVHWRDFGHVIARTWEEVPAVWRRVYMTRPALVKRFGKELGNQIPLDTRPDEERKNADAELSNQACIYEIWDKDTNTAIWISKSFGKALDALEDPLKLESFFPCPRPLFATITTDSLVPVPDFTMYQDQAYELDSLAQTIDGLIKALQIRGVYNAAIPELARLFTEAGNTDLIPVNAWNVFAEKNGLKGTIDIVDLTPFGNALAAAYGAVEHLKNEIYEITGLGDVIRGSNDPRETATAVKTKGQFGSMRLRSMQGDVVQYATEILQIKAQIMCSQYSDTTLLQIAGSDELSPQDKALLPQALKLIRNNPLRNFRIEVSSDSMIYMDEAQEKQDRMELMKASSDLLKEVVQISMSPKAEELLPLAIDLMKFGITSFKVGKTLEGAFDQLGDTLRDEAQKKASQSPAPTPPPPQVQVAQMNLQADAQKFQAQNQFEMQKMQAQAQLEQQNKMVDLQVEQQRMAAETAAEKQRQMNEMAVAQHAQQVQAMQVEAQNKLEAQREMLQAQNDANIEKMRMMHEQVMETQRQQFELLMKRLDNATKIDVAEIAAATTLQSAQVSAANQAAQDSSTTDGGMNE